MTTSAGVAGLVPFGVVTITSAVGVPGGLVAVMRGGGLSAGAGVVPVSGIALAGGQHQATAAARNAGAGARSRTARAVAGP